MTEKNEMLRACVETAETLMAGSSMMRRLAAMRPGDGSWTETFEGASSLLGVRRNDLEMRERLIESARILEDDDLEDEQMEEFRTDCLKWARTLERGAVAELDRACRVFPDSSISEVPGISHTIGRFAGDTRTALCRAWLESGRASRDSEMAKDIEHNAMPARHGERAGGFFSRRTGFSLVDVLIAIVIAGVGIMSIMALTVMLQYRQDAGESRSDADLFASSWAETFSVSASAKQAVLSNNSGRLDAAIRDVTKATFEARGWNLGVPPVCSGGGGTMRCDGSGRVVDIRTSRNANHVRISMTIEASGGPEGDPQKNHYSWVSSFASGRTYDGDGPWESL